MTFQKATKFGAKLRMALIGTSGSGKTYSALAIASGLGKRIAFIDTERGSARKYADQFEFDVIELDTFSPQTFIDWIKVAEKEKYDVLIIDSLSHAWMGKDGILEFVDTVTERSRSKNAYTSGWREATPLHNKLVDTILGANLHVIACMRSKTEYVMQDDPRTGKKVPTKIGMQPVQRDGMEYEFDVIGDMTMEHRLIIGKTRCPQIDGKIFDKPGEEFAAILAEWLGGDPAPDPKPTAPKPEPPKPAAKPAATTPEPAPVADTAELEQAKDTARSLLSALHKGNLNGYGDASQIREDMQAALGVSNLDDCQDVVNLRLYIDYLTSVRRSDTSFEHLPLEKRQVPEYALHQCYADIQTEMNRRQMSDDLRKFYSTKADELYTSGSPTLASILDAVRSQPLKPEPVSGDINDLRNAVSTRLQKLIANKIDGFEVSSRLTNSVNQHLGCPVAKCTDPDALTKYIEHLDSIINNYFKEVS